ncbi:hypothetical protein CFOL_v3_07432 [Cephalotus follicularis]|uniref:Dilute domain-containing protein n=1 Tax=Cephalotus follicularis TaxID=3775 RepID=A0A1Q3B7T8_CEPFO|nr:hypothetical protein CFOL_v3_07432 [Cephalotus follicularis]
MKEIDKRRSLNDIKTKRSGRTERKDRKPRPENKIVNANETEIKVPNDRQDSDMLVSDSNAATQPSQVKENLVIPYVDDANRSNEASQHPNANVDNKDGILDDSCSYFDTESKPGKEESDSETNKDSVSSQGDSLTAEDDEKVERASGVSKIIAKESSVDGLLGLSRVKTDCGLKKSPSNPLNNSYKKCTITNRGASKVSTKITSAKNTKVMEAPPKPSSESSEEVDYKRFEEAKEIDDLDEASNGAQSVGSDNDNEDEGEHEDEVALNQRIEEMETRIEKLEEELREVAALEISLYSVVAEHGSSAHKVHTPARRLSRLYIHACKHWTQSKRAIIAKNTVSGLVLIAKSCGNDVSRLSFWLSNTIVLREIISEAFGSARNSIPVTNLAESNGGIKKIEGKSVTLKWNGGSGCKQVNGFVQLGDDWQETGTFTAALEKFEAWIFSRIVESVWWQALTPHMQSAVENLSTNKFIGSLLGPAFGDQQQGSFSINLWKNAFQDVFQRLCPVRAGGHECGCLPVLARKVMEQCVTRLDVAMFNAILRESAHEIPTDPVSDPILDSKVLPIPAGDLSFGSGAQLKNIVGNWSRWLTDKFGMDIDYSSKEDQHSIDDGDSKGGDGEPKSFLLLNSLSDLLMLPKDMLMDRSIRLEVCPSISLALVKRILCNFTPDEFCPDPVPGSVLEAVNAESIVERRFSGDSARSFPYTAAPVVYAPPSSADVVEKVAEVGVRSRLSSNVSVIQRKGYTSDEELEELDFPLMSIIDKLPSSPTIIANGDGKEIDSTGYSGINARYRLLREVWSS